MLLGTPLQTSYVTACIDRAWEVLGKKFGVTAFFRDGPRAVEWDTGETMTLRMAHAWIGSTWLEIIEPVDGAVEVYRDWLANGRFELRFHHVGIRIPDLVTWDRTLAEIEAAGHRTIFSITKNRSQKVCYVDTAQELGHYIEYLYIPDAGQSTMAKLPQNIPGFAAVF